MLTDSAFTSEDCQESHLLHGVLTDEIIAAAVESASRTRTWAFGSIDQLHPVHQAQLLTYLRLSGLLVGLLINFNVRMLRDGILRRNI